ncbi:kinase-like protein [Exidia glandulosa HHB12029]|uniref:Kinase-like protein n=1 Tax=Exidia glandulosa HHB12029 TaxID=1314781 RepID=A0A165CVI5_EXIGL|nr:kinase-like protein [Exidia glandulosa HHB12029]
MEPITVDIVEVHHAMQNTTDLTTQVENVTPVGALGGMSDMYQGYWSRPDKEQVKVAIKLVRFPSSTPTAKMQRHLAREVHIWSFLHHAHILPLYGTYSGLRPGCPGMVSPWCEKGNILQFLDQQRNSPNIQELVNKAGNILVSADGNALICDFGLATILTGDQSAQTFSSFVKGTCRWMAPELFEHDQAKHTKASDVWAFGCVILEVRKESASSFTSPCQCDPY